MHGISAHSALAIKRQRRRRGDARGRKRRQSMPQVEHYEGDNKVMGTITMFHVGAVFLLLSAFLILSAVLTSDSRQETAELVGTGVICLLIGLFLIVLNRFYGQKEDDDLANYVEQRLGRSRSGQRLYHEQESMQDFGGGPSASASMDSNVSRDMSTRSKGNKKGKKSKHRGGSSSGIEETAVVNGADPKVKVDIVNEHNQHRNHQNVSNDITTSANVTLDRIAEEATPDSQYQNQPISYVTASYEDNLNRGASNNLYRVYDRESPYTARVGGAV